MWRPLAGMTGGMLLEGKKIPGNCLQISEISTILHLWRGYNVSGPMFDRNSSYILLEVRGNVALKKKRRVLSVLNSFPTLLPKQST